MRIRKYIYIWFSWNVWTGWRISKKSQCYSVNQPWSKQNKINQLHLNQSVVQLKQKKSSTLNQSIIHPNNNWTIIITQPMNSNQANHHQNANTTFKLNQSIQGKNRRATIEKGHQCRAWCQQGVTWQTLHTWHANDAVCLRIIQIKINLMKKNNNLGYLALLQCINLVSEVAADWLPLKPCWWLSLLFT